MNYTFEIAIGLIAWGLITIAISIYQTDKQRKLINEAHENARELTAEATILAIASTLAAQHLTTEMSAAEAETTIRMWIPVARNIVMK